MADRIEVRCGKCGAGLQAPISLAGKRAKCRVCGNKMTVPIPPPPVDELLPLDDEPLLFEPAKPSRKRPRDEDDFEDDDRPRRKRPAKSRPIWPWFAGGGVLLVVVVSITLYFAFGAKPGGELLGGSTTASIYGKWHATTPDVEYEYEFQEGGFSLVSSTGLGQFSVRRFNCEVKTSGGDTSLIMDSRACTATFEADGRLTLQKSFRLTRDGLELTDNPITLERGPMKDRDR